jgi:cell division protease FtsH
MLGGRVSEELFIGEIGTGASDDFRKATAIVRRMIVEYGMSDKLGPMQFGQSQGQVFLGRDFGHEQNYSDAIAYEIDQEMQLIIRRCYDRAKEILSKYKDQVHLIANTLLERETLDKDQIIQLIEQGKIGESGESSESTTKDDEPKVKIQAQDQQSEANKLDFERDKDKKEE